MTDEKIIEIARRYDPHAPDLLEALLVAHDHIDMAALEISHCKDAEQIRAAIAKSRGQED